MPTTNKKLEVALLIDGVRFRFWSRIRMGFAVDGVAIIEFEAPFDPTDAAQREAFRPGGFKPMSVTVDNRVVFTGTMINSPSDTNSGSTTVLVSGYSKPGVLDDCMTPVEDLPSEFKGQNLHEIAEAVIAPFGLEMESEVDPGPQFELVTRKVTQKVWPFLTELAQQRNQVISDTADGKVLFRQSAIATTPVVILSEADGSPLLKVTPQYNLQEYFSEITGYVPVKARAKKSVAYTVKNKFLPDVLRPYSFEVQDVKEGDVLPCVIAKGSRMFANAVAYRVDLDTWRTPTGEFLWSPNMTVRLHAPNNMIYQPYDFIVRTVELNLDSDEETASLGLVMPGAFEGEPPERLPWDE